MQGSPLNFNVFWRTFVLLALLLAGGIVAWVHTLRALDLEPRAVHEARQLASMVNLTRAALLQQSDGIARLALIKSFDKADSVQVRPREPTDQWEPFEVDAFSRAVARELRATIGGDAVVARNVNGQKGLWVGFMLDRDPYWLITRSGARGLAVAADPHRWIGIALLATLAGQRGLWPV